MRAYLQVLDMSGCAVVGVSKVVVMWVKLGYNIMNMDFPSIRPPHGNIVAQVDDNQSTLFSGVLHMKCV